MRKLSIICDLDSIAADLMKKWMEHYNRDHNAAMTKEHHTSWDVHNNVPIGHRIYEYLYQPGFFEDLEPLPGAIESLNLLQNRGHKVTIATAYSYPGTSATDKVTWCRNHLPFLNKRQIFLGHQKEMLKGDVFIDDSPDNITNYRREWPNACIATISHLYNEHVKDKTDIFALDYKDTAAAWKTIIEGIMKLEAT